MTYSQRSTRPAIINGNDPKPLPTIPYNPDYYTVITDKDYYPLPGTDNRPYGVSEGKWERHLQKAHDSVMSMRRLSND